MPSDWLMGAIIILAAKLINSAHHRIGREHPKITNSIPHPSIMSKPSTILRGSMSSSSQGIDSSPISSSEPQRRTHVPTSPRLPRSLLLCRQHQPNLVGTASRADAAVDRKSFVISMIDQALALFDDDLQDLDLFGVETETDGEKDANA
jgi:hypothetical protein